MQWKDGYFAIMISGIGGINDGMVGHGGAMDGLASIGEKSPFLV